MPKKIMLVEDDANLREIYGARLLAEGYLIVTARDGEEALALVVEEKPDLIITDIMMPKISGFDMLDILRSTPETKNTKIVMMTALSQMEDKTRADKLGADKYLVKSQVTLDDVARVVHQLLGDQPEAEADATQAPAGSTAAQETSEKPVSPPPETQEEDSQTVEVKTEPKPELDASLPPITEKSAEPKQVVDPVETSGSDTSSSTNLSADEPTSDPSLDNLPGLNLAGGGTTVPTDDDIVVPDLSAVDTEDVDGKAPNSTSDSSAADNSALSGASAQALSSEEEKKDLEQEIDKVIESDTSTGDSQTPAPEAEVSKTEGNTAGTGRKEINPLPREESDEAPKTDINSLYEKEMAKEAEAADGDNHPVAPPISKDDSASAERTPDKYTLPSQDEPKKDENVDPNSISL